MSRFCLGLRWIVLSVPVAAIGVAAIGEGVPCRAEDKPIGYRLAEGKDLLLESDLANRKLVVIYYANDNYPPTGDNPIQRNRRTLIAALQDGTKSRDFTQDERTQLATLHDQLERQISDLHYIVSQDLTLLRRQVGKTAHGLVVFRNFYSGASTDNLSPLRNLFRQFEWRYFVAGGVSGEIRSLPIPYEFFRTEYVWMPLAHPAVLHHALEEVGKVFAPSQHRFLLLIRSPVTKENLLAAPLSVDVTKLEGGKVCRALLQAFPPRTVKGPEDFGDLWGRANQTLVDAFHASAAAEASKKRTVNPISGKELEEALMAEIGTSKKYFLQTFAPLAGGDFRKGFYFSLIIVASPRGALELSTDSELKVRNSYAELGIPNVGRLYTWGDKAFRSDPLDLANAVKETGPPSTTDLQEILLRYLER